MNAFVFYGCLDMQIAGPVIILNSNHAVRGIFSIFKPMLKQRTLEKVHIVVVCVCVYLSSGVCGGECGDISA